MWKKRGSGGKKGRKNAIVCKGSSQDDGIQAAQTDLLRPGGPEPACPWGSLGARGKRIQLELLSMEHTSFPGTKKLPSVRQNRREPKNAHMSFV